VIAERSDDLMSIETTGPEVGPGRALADLGEPTRNAPPAGVTPGVLAGWYEHLARMHEQRAEQIGDEHAAVREFGYAAVAQERAGALAETAVPGGEPPSLPEQRANARRGRSFGRCPRRPARADGNPAAAHQQHPQR
jgi:hypothetical protein